MASGSGSLDYFETVQVLNSWARELVLVYPISEPPAGGEPSESDFISGLSIWGTFKPQGDPAAGARRSLSDVYAKIRPELALGDAPLELYERQAAGYTFESMAGERFEIAARCGRRLTSQSRGSCRHDGRLAGRTDGAVGDLPLPGHRSDPHVGSRPGRNLRRLHPQWEEE